jgi:D-amino peptidase
VSGDRVAVEQLQKAVPSVRGVIVKEPLGYHSASTLVPARSRALIERGVAETLEGVASLKPYALAAPIDLEVGFKFTLDAERAAYIPSLSRADAHTVRGRFPDILQITRLVQVLTSLEQP